MERLIELASLARRARGAEMNIVLNDDRLGRVSLRLVERSGLVDAIVRTNTTRTAQALSESLPALIESLSRGGLQAAAASASAPGGGLDRREEEGQRRNKQSREPDLETRRRVGRQAPAFRLDG